MMLLALWLLSQTLGFALPVLSSVAEQELPFCPAREEREAGNANVAYDVCSLTCLVYDAESPPATTQGLNDSVGTVPTTPAYDACPLSTIQVAGAPGAPPVADAGCIAAKTPLFSGTTGAAMDSAQFSRIQSAFQRRGGVMQADAESSRLLEALGKEGAAIDATTIILRQNPSRSAVFEELIHSAQYRRGMTDATLMEIQAAEKLIRFRHAYKIPNAETRQTIQNLRALRGEP